MPSSRQISSICGDIYDVFVDPRKIEQFLLYDQAHVSIGKGDVIDPNAYPQIVHAVQQEDRTTDILRVLSTLTNTEKEIIIDCYGIGREKTLSERDIATNRDLTSERVRQIKEKAIRRMKHPSRSAVLRKYL
jgi:DNA-directed RNA polymerase sigma subunit (sigma70/sigma32)